MSIGTSLDKALNASKPIEGSLYQAIGDVKNVDLAEACNSVWSPVDGSYLNAGQLTEANKKRLALALGKAMLNLAKVCVSCNLNVSDVIDKLAPAAPTKVESTK